MVFLAAIITSAILWFMVTSNFLNRLDIDLFIFNNFNIGPYLVPVIVFFIVYLSIRILVQNAPSFISDRLIKLCQNRGLSGWLDWAVIIIIALCSIASIGLEILTPYLILTLSVFLLSAVESLSGKTGALITNSNNHVLERGSFISVENKPVIEDQDEPISSSSMDLTSSSETVLAETQEDKDDADD